MDEKEKLMQEVINESYDNDADKRRNWAGFVEGKVVSFFDGNELEKMSIEDGNGNKAKLARTKNNEIKIEYTSSVVL